ncbi:MAG: M16 family metallopeptidase [Planctomycetota bacterium]|jgi:zinc protease
MKRTALVGILLSVILTGACFGQANKVKPDMDPASDKMFDYRQITLDNGLKVITLEDFSCPIVSVQVWYQVGSKDEKSDRQGYAHMFEHMMFKGTEFVSEKDHFNLLRKVGGTCNAYTSFDRTVYHETLPADQIELALWLEAERMSFLKIDQHAFDTERKVVEEELRMRENQPYGNVFKKVFGALFEEHPYHWTPIGNLAHLRATSVADLRAFWKKYYLPNNATLIIVGDIEHEKAQELAKQYFGWIKPGPQPQPVTIKEPAIKEPKIIEIDDENAPAGQVMLAWRTIPTGTQEETVLDLLSSILGSGRSSRIYRDLVANSQVAVVASTWTYNLQQDGIFVADATLPPNSKDYEKARDALLTQIKLIQQNGVTEKELEKARNKMLKSIVTTNLQIESKAALLGNAAVTMGDVSRVNRFIDEIRAVTGQDIQNAAKKYLNENQLYQFTILQNNGMEHASKDNEDAGITAEPELEAPAPGRKGLQRPDDYPTLAPVADKDAAKINLKFKKAELSNGLKILVVSNHEVPFVSVKLGLTNGAWTEAHPGTAALAAQMLTRGTAKHDEAQLAAVLDQYAISLSGSADMDTAAVSANCLTEQLDRAMSLMAEVVLEPTFEKAEFDKLLKQEITGLNIQEQEPRYLAGKYYNQMLFGQHPYGRMVKGSVKDLKQLTPDQLKLWWAKFARPDQATLIFAGDIEKDQAVALAKKYLGDWKTDLVETGIVLTDIPKAAPTKIYIVDRPGSAQAQIRVGQLGLTRQQQPDYFISLIAGSYFGGSFHSRLNESIRVKRGLTYGAWGSFRPKVMAGTFDISTFTKNESTAETISVILDLVREFQTVEPTDAEFYDTRSYITGSFARNRETPQDVARDLWMIESEKLDKGYFKDLFKTLNNATKQDCMDLASNVINPDRLTIVVVGDANALKEDLEKVAPVEIIKPDNDA